MHILATFATLCCQTRWPRNHSCTTQEHVSFFRTFSGTRQKPTGQNRTFSRFSRFSSFLRICRFLWKTMRICEKQEFCLRACSRKIFSLLACSQKLFVKCANAQKLVVHKSDKCANVQKPSVHKMRKSAIQNNFQMQKSQICTVHNFWNAEFTNAQFIFSMCV